MTKFTSARLKALIAGFTISLSVVAVSEPSYAYIFGFSGNTSVDLNLDTGTISADFDANTGYAAIGWYDALGTHYTNNDNYLTETPGEELSFGYNSFFVFDISGLTGPVSTGSLTLDTFQDTVSETYRLGSYSKNIARLIDGTGGMAAYNALGNGTYYGSFAYTPADSNSFETIALNASFVSGINAAIAAGDTRFAIGGTVSTAVPEASTWAMLIVGFAAMGFAGWRKSKSRAFSVTSIA